MFSVYKEYYGMTSPFGKHDKFCRDLPMISFRIGFVPVTLAKKH